MAALKAPKERKKPAARPKKDDVVDEDGDVWLTLRLPPYLHRDAKMLSALDDRSMNKWLVRAVEAFAEAEKERLKIDR